MKLSVSLPEDDVAFLDDYANQQSLDSRSAAVQRAISLLRASELGDAYEEAWDEWFSSGEAGVWERTAGDQGTSKRRAKR